MPITDKDVADLCVGIYAYPGSPPVTWDRFDDGDDSDQICWSVKVVDGCDVVVFRGSVMAKSAPSIPVFYSGSIKSFRSTGTGGAATSWSPAIRWAPDAPRSSAD